MKNLALSLTAEDIQRFVTKVEADGKLICLEPIMYPLCRYRKRTIQQVLFDIMNASRITRVINREILEMGYNVCVDGSYYLSI